MSKTGHYKTEVIDHQSNTYGLDANVKMLITVDETFDNDHRVVSKRDSHSGRFTFSAADSGQHKICLTPDGAGSSGSWMLSGALDAVRVTLDMAIGETSKIETEDKGKMHDIVQRVKDLNGRLHDIRREQVFQRVWPLPSSPLYLHQDREITPVDANRFYRNAKLSSVTNPKPPTLASSAGLSSNSSFCQLPAPGNCRISGRSSSSKS